MKRSAAASALVFAACAGVPEYRSAVKEDSAAWQGLDTEEKEERTQKRSRKKPLAAIGGAWNREPPPPPLKNPSRHHAAGPDEFVLPNGLRLIVVRQGQRPVVSVRLIFAHGAASDPVGGLGTTYFAIALLGDLYEENDASEALVGEDSLRRQIWHVGGRYRYHVGSDDASIGIDGYADDVNHYIDLMAAAVRVPRTGAEMFSLRRDGLIHTLEDISITDDDAFFRYISKAAFGVSHVYARSVYGTVSSLKELGIEQIVERQQTVLSPAGATLLVVGNISPSKVLARVRKRFGPWRKRRRKSQRVPAPRVRRRRHVTLLPRTAAGTMALCGARPLTDIKKRDAQLDVLAHILGGGINGRFAHSLRGVHGLSYSAWASIVRRRHARALLACTRVPPKSTTQALTLFVAFLKEAQKVPPTPDELARAKAQIIAQVVTQQQSVGQTVGTWMEATQLGRAPHGPRYVKAIQAVTIEDIHRLAKRVLSIKHMQLLLSGPKHLAAQAVRKNRLGRTRTAKLVY